MKRLAIVSTHPIQYYAPLFKMLAKENLVLKVFYTWGKQSIAKFDPGFKQIIEWDIPLLEGYDYEFLINTSKNAGSTRFSGIVNPEAIDKITQFCPNAILIFGWSYHSHLKILRHFKGKTAIWFRGDSTLIDNTSTLKKALKKILLRWVYSYIDKAFHVGSNNKEYYKEFGIRQEQLIFAPHAIENERFSQKYTEQADNLRESLDIRKDEILILFAGKFESKKDPLLLLDAFIALQNSATHLLFVGNGDQETELKQLAINLPGKVHFINFQNQRIMPVIYQSCDLFCLPSKGPGETWGLAVNEAMAAGKAILASDRVGCARDLVEIDSNGYIFEAGNKEDLMEKLSSLCDVIKLRRFGKRSEAIIKEWSLRSTVTSLLKELRNED